MCRYRSYFILILHLGLALLTVACGKTNLPAYAQVQPSLGSHLTQCTGEEDDPKMPAQPLETRIWNASRGKLHCELEGECHPAVAMVSVVIKKTIERCTGFLVAPDMVVTNDHCISNSTAVRENNGNCEHLIYAHFAAAGGDSKAQSASCKRIVVRSNQCGLGSKDYAVIQLDRPIVDRKPLPISQRGFVDGETATIYRVQMRGGLGSGTLDGVQSKTNCSAAYRTMVYPALQSSRSPLMTFGDCPIQKGNSGSPALNESGEVGAIIQGYLEPPSDRKLHDQLQTVLLDQTYGEVGLGTQLACAFELSGSRSSCTQIPEIYTLYPKTFVTQIGEFDQRMLPPLGPNERWRQIGAPSTSQRIFLRAPICVTPSRSLSFQSTILGYRRGINQKLQAEWRSIARTEQKDLVFQATATSRASGSIQFTNENFGSILIPVCGGRLTRR